MGMISGLIPSTAKKSSLDVFEGKPNHVHDDIASNAEFIIEVIENIYG